MRLKSFRLHFFIIGAVMITLIGCADIAQKERAESILYKTKPVVLKSSDSPSGKYIFEILGFPGVEECNHQYIYIIQTIYGWPPRELVPCAYRIIEEATGSLIRQSSVVPLKTLDSKSGKECHHREELMFILHGFKNWTIDDEIGYYVLGLPETGPHARIYDWRTCSDKEDWRLQFSPNISCANPPCDSYTSFIYKGKSFLVYWNRNQGSLAIRKLMQSKANDEFDYYSLDSITGKPRLDERKSYLLVAIPSTVAPEISVDEPRLILKTNDQKYVFNAAIEKLE